MEELQQGVITPAVKGKGRKKLSCKSEWKRIKEQKKRHSAKGFPELPDCNHPEHTHFNCSSLTMQDVRRAHQKFYAETNKIKQDEVILRFTHVTSVNRVRSRENQFSKDVTIKYQLPRLVGNHSEMTTVCKKAFCQVLQVTKRQVEITCKKYFTTGDNPRENRGGDTKSEKYIEHRTAVKQFIEKLAPIESHYNRSRNITRFYLSSDLTIKKLWKMYNETKPELTVKYDYFRQIFDTEYNIGFGSPATDSCSFCLMTKERIKLSVDPIEKTELSTKLKVHKMKADRFYKKLAEKEEGVITLSFDCQKNQVIPKLSDQRAYYSRQLYVFNFTICLGSSHDHQNSENTFLHIWTESEHKKGSNEIASCIFHRLCNMDFTECHTIRLFSDGCGGQNKNQIVLGMLCNWLQNRAPPQIKTVLVFYPVVGHSYIPPDRVFGRLEKTFTAKDTIVSLEEYIQIFENEGTVIRVVSNTQEIGVKCVVFDWKTAVQNVFKTPAQYHFKFAPTKRLILTRSNRNNVLIQGEVHYETNLGNPLSLCKRGKTLRLEPRIINDGVTISRENKNDVDNLLQAHFGQDWRILEHLQYFKSVIDENNNHVQGGIDGNDNEEIIEDDNYVV